MSLKSCFFGPFSYDHGLLFNRYYGVLSPGVRRSGSEADHSSPSTAESKKFGAIAPLSSYAFKACTGTIIH